MEIHDVMSVDRVTFAHGTRLAPTDRLQIPNMLGASDMAGQPGRGRRLLGEPVQDGSSRAGRAVRRRPMTRHAQRARDGPGLDVGTAWISKPVAWRLLTNTGTAA